MPTLTEIPELANLLATLQTAKPLTHGPVTVIPLVAPNPDNPNWLTLDDLIEPSPPWGEGRVRGEAGARPYITEATEAGTIPFLKVTNEAARPLLLLDGEELLGAKQNRILNTTVLVAAHTELTIPVSCVEQGRWGYRGRRFTPGDASLYASLRARKAARVSQSLRAGRGHMADQGEVWEQLSVRAEQLQVDSQTDAMHDLYARHETDMAAARQAPGRPAGPGGRPRLYGQPVGGPRLFARAWPRLSAGYVADAIGRKPKRGRRMDAGPVLSALAQSQVEPAPAVGLGEEVSPRHPPTGGGHPGHPGASGSPDGVPRCGRPLRTWQVNQ